MSHPWQVQASARMTSLGSGLQPQMSMPVYQQPQQQQPNSLFQQQPQAMFQQQQQQIFQQPLGIQQQQQVQGPDKNKGFGSSSVTYPFQTSNMPPPSVTLGGNAGPLSMVSSLPGNMGSAQVGGGTSLMGSPSLPLTNLASLSSPGTVSYPLPRRGISGAPPMNVPPPNLMPNTNGSGGNEVFTPRTRVFTGTITKLYDNFGFVDGDVFFQTNVCTGGLQPKLGDKAIVDASYNASMPFKWNATRLQVLPTGQDFNSTVVEEDRGRSRNDKRREPRSRNKDREAERDAEREKRREERQREREREKEKEKEREIKKARSRSPSRRRTRSRSPPRRHSRPVPKYNVNVPKISLDMSEASLPELRRRYPNLYIPSDFCTASATWLKAFPTHRPLGLDQQSAFHVMHKEVDPVEPNPTATDPSDADFTYSAKVMLLSLPTLEDMFRKSCALAEDNQDGDVRDGFVHPTRLINFLVGSKGKSDTMAIGGPWSPSLDGPNPDKDPSVLIKTAIRTCRSLTGIDLSRCVQWYRFLELHYRRADSSSQHKQQGKVETVVLFLPDVWSCVPTRLEWEGLQLSYNKQLARITSGSGDQENAADDDAAGDQSTNDQKDDKGGDADVKKIEPTHYSQLDPKTMKMTELRHELEARGLSPKGLNSQLVARLSKVLKTEQDSAEEEEAAAVAAAVAAKVKADLEEKEKQQQVTQERDVDSKAVERKKKEDEDKKRQEERERQARERRYQLPSSPHILVHPSRTAKSGKFDCTVMSLSLLLDYRAEDTKEHSFEVSLFAELFNEMLMRDFGFLIYRALVDAPEKPKEEEKDKRESKERKKDKEDGDKKEKEGDGDKDSEASEENGSKKKERERREKIKMVTTDPQLLLAFVYFDQTHCGYIFDRDMEEILHTLGLSLSRAQCRRLLQKVLTRDTLSYRKLTDHSESETSNQVVREPEAELLHCEELAGGNKRLLPQFGVSKSAAVVTAKENGEEETEQTETTTTSEPPPTVPETGIVNWRGSIVDVAQLLAQVERSEKSRRDTEAKVIALETELNGCLGQAKQSSDEVNHLAKQLSDCRNRLHTKEDELKISEDKCHKFLSALSSVNKLVRPVLNQFITLDDAPKQERQESSKSSVTPAVGTSTLKVEPVSAKQEVKIEDEEMEVKIEESRKGDSKNDADN